MSLTIEEIKKSFEENPKRKYSISGYGKIPFHISEAWITSIRKDRINFEMISGKGACSPTSDFCVPFKDWDRHGINKVKRKKTGKK
jgi:hypothetical protein